MNWFLYIIQTTNNKLYTGITTDINRRFNEHLNKSVGAKFLKSNPPKKIVFLKLMESRSLASKEEYQIKQLSRDNKLYLISTHKKKSDKLILKFFN